MLNSFLYLLIHSSFKVDNTEWKDKKSIVYWRGTTSGAEYTIETRERYHRQRLMRLYQNHSLFDIAFWETSWCISPNCDEFMRSKFRFDEFRDYKYMMNYKYLIDIV